MKRSRHFRPITLGIIGASVFALSACKQEEEQATAFPDLKSCLAESAKPGATMSSDDCTTAYAEAVKSNAADAPKYDAMTACEAEHGAGNCQQAQNSEGGGSIFLPLLTGFLVGKMLSGGGSIFGQPLYSRPNGTFATPGGQGFSSNRGASVVPASTFQKPAAGAWNGSKQAVTSTGGFGKTMTGTAG